MKFLRSILLWPLKVLNSFSLRLNKVHVSEGLEINGLLLLKNKGVINFGRNIKINSSSLRNVIGGDTRCSIVVNKGARLYIGNNVKISNSAIYSNNEISIHDNVMIGGSCRIWDTDFHPIDPVVRYKTPNENFSSRKITIRKNAFIGGGSIILKGVTIGENAVIGAGSVVSKDVPKNEIWAGNPVKFLRKLNK